MRKICFYSFVLFCTNLFSQTSVKFDYDPAGNMIKRYIQIIPFRLGQIQQPKDSILNFSVYPNPTQDHFTIEGPLENNTKEAQVLLYNINGAVVMKDVYYGNKKTYAFNELTSGVYFLEIKYSKKQSSNYRILITQ